MVAVLFHIAGDDLELLAQVVELGGDGLEQLLDVGGGLGHGENIQQLCGHIVETHFQKKKRVSPNR